MNTTFFPGFAKSFLEHAVVKEVAIVNGLINPGQFLPNNPAGTNI